MSRAAALPPGRNLGFVYVTEGLAPQLETLLAALTEATGIRAWTGGAGYGVCAGDAEYYEQPALALLTASVPEAAVLMLDGTRATEASGWCAEHPGALDRRIEVPVFKPSMPAFGGSRLDTLFVTSIDDARPGRGAAQGALIAIDLSADATTGRPETLFAGQPPNSRSERA